LTLKGEKSRIWQREYRKKNHAHIIERTNNYIKNHKEAIKTVNRKAKNKQRQSEQYCQKERNRNRFYKYGITPDEYNELFNAHDGCCWICGAHQSNFSVALYIDHDHETKKIRGLLCQSCNFLLGFSKDNVDILQKAIKYLTGDNI